MSSFFWVITYQILQKTLSFFIDRKLKELFRVPIECFVTRIPCESIIDDVEVFWGHARVRVELAEQIRVLEQQFQKFISRSVS